MANKDFYTILGVEKSASKDDIKKAFHKLAHKYHPDKNKGDDSKFKEVNEAYQTLSDDKKRAQYDQFGSAGAQGFGGFSGQQQGGFGGFDFSGFQNGQGFDMGDLGDIFSDFFGGGQQQRTRRGSDIATEITIPFHDAIFGTKRSVMITKTDTCGTCHGKGAKPGTSMDTCTKCNGKGQIREARQTVLGAFATTRTCEYCEGLGTIPKEKCTTCRGAGILRQQSQIDVTIPAGINPGEMIRMSGMGEAVAHGTTGDLYIKINVTPHQRIRREGVNLTTDVTIKLTDALLGAEHSIDTLDGMLKLEIPMGIQSGETIRLKDKGVPGRAGKRGDLIVHVTVTIPQKLSKKAKDLIDELKKEGI